VVLKQEQDLAILEICDDGVGFDYDRVQLGQGLVNMRNRVIRLEGSFAVNSSPGTGTRLSMTFPV
jgi:signal transduction histidine kinase